MRHGLIAGMFALCGGCMSGGDLLGGLAAGNPHDAGPRVVWDLDAESLPDIPFPNDVGTRVDPGSPTGRRVNVSLNAPTAHERKLRLLIDGLDGFGTYSPLWVRFDGRVDLAGLDRVQNDADPKNDAVYVINLNPASNDYGQPLPLDVGRGRFPLGLENSDNYFANDPRGASSNLIFETMAESDLNGNGRLDPDEDTDADGVFDRPNLWGEALADAGRMDPYRDLITFYELETDTLILRTVFPREPGSTYAVVVTRGLVGADSGSPVRPPFADINHAAQTEALRPLVEDRILTGLGLGFGDIAFAWTFTTQSTSRDLQVIRSGLYGFGPMAYLNAALPPRLSAVAQVDTPEYSDNVYVLTTERLLQALENPAVRDATGLSDANAALIFDDYRTWIDGFVFLELQSPAFIDNDDGVFRVDPLTGAAEWSTETVYMVCTLPKATAGRAPPFPVTFYAHGYTSSRFELLGFAGAHARLGLSTCAIDAYGHGLPTSDLLVELVKSILRQEHLDRFADVLAKSRARDLNADGATDSGGDFWTANIFHTRDVVRQSLVDTLQALRIVKSFGKTTMPIDRNGDGQDDLAGDFNGDGVADIGGDVPYYGWGQSLGGILTMLLGPLEPAMLATAPTSGGGGLVDLALRSKQGGVVQAVFLPLFGPILVGEPSATAGRVDLEFDLLDVNDERRIRFAQVPDSSLGSADAIAVGDRVRVTNLDNGETDETVVQDPTGGDPAGRFRLQIAADVGDRLRLELFRGKDGARYRVIETFETDDLSDGGFQGKSHAAGDTLVALQDGFGLRRGTPAFRRLISLAQMVVDPGDPVNYARYYAEPLDLPPEGRVPTNLLAVTTVGDMNVPVNTGIAFGRAAGLFSVRQPDPLYGTSDDLVLVDHWVVEGLEKLRRFADDPCHYDPRAVLFDVDEASRGVDPTQGPHLSLVERSPWCDGSSGEPAACHEVCVAALPLRATRVDPWGVSGLRIPYVRATGQHGFGLPDPSLPFDYNVYQVNQISWFFATRGQEISDDPCLATSSCSFFGP